MKRIKFIYFEGCPNAKEILDLLDELGIDFEKIEQNLLAPEDKQRNYSSPSILSEGQIIFGTQAVGGGCSLNLKKEDIKDFLLSIK